MDGWARGRSGLGELGEGHQHVAWMKLLHKNDLITSQLDVNYILSGSDFVTVYVEKIVFKGIKQCKDKNNYCLNLRVKAR